jgi:hypothetical protein
LLRPLRSRLRERSVVERQQELAAVRLQPLDGMRDAGGEIPEVAGTHIGDEVAAVLVGRDDLCAAGQAGRSCFQPMQGDRQRAAG